MYPIKKTGVPFSIDISSDNTITYTDYVAVLTNSNDGVEINQVFNDLGIAEFVVSSKGMYSLNIENYLTRPVSIIVSDSNIRDLEQTIVDTNTYVQGLHETFSTVLNEQLQELSSKLFDIHADMQDATILDAIQTIINEIKDSTLATNTHTTTEMDKVLVNNEKSKNELQESLGSVETGVTFKLDVIHDLVAYIKENVNTTSEDTINSILEIVTYLNNNVDTSLDNKILNVQAMLEGKEYVTLEGSNISTESSVGLREVWDNLTLEHNTRIDEILALIGNSKVKILQAETETSIDLGAKLEEIKTLVTNVANVDHSALDIKEILDKNYIETAVGNVGISNQVESVSLLLHAMNNALKDELKSIDFRLENINESILSKKDELSEEILALGGTNDENNVANLNQKLDTIISNVDTRAATLEGMLEDSTAVESAIGTVRSDIEDLSFNINLNNSTNVETLSQIIDDVTDIKQAGVIIDNNVKTVKTNTNTILTNISDNSSKIGQSNSSLTEVKDSLGLVRADVANSRTEMADVISSVSTVSDTVTALDENVNNTLTDVSNSLENVNESIGTVKASTKAIVDRMGSSFDVVTNYTWDIDSDQNTITVIAPEDNSIFTYIKASDSTGDFSELYTNYEKRDDGTYVSTVGFQSPYIDTAIECGEYMLKVKSGTFEVFRNVTIAHHIQESNELRVLVHKGIVTPVEAIQMTVLAGVDDVLSIQEKTEGSVFTDIPESLEYIDDGMFKLILKRDKGDYIFRLTNQTSGSTTVVKVLVEDSVENVYAQNTNKKVTNIKNSLAKIGL